MHGWLAHVVAAETDRQAERQLQAGWLGESETSNRGMQACSWCRQQRYEHTHMHLSEFCCFVSELLISERFRSYCNIVLYYIWYALLNQCWEARTYILWIILRFILVGVIGLFVFRGIIGSHECKILFNRYGCDVSDWPSLAPESTVSSCWRLLPFPRSQPPMRERERPWSVPSSAWAVRVGSASLWNWELLDVRACHHIIWLQSLEHSQVRWALYYYSRFQLDLMRVRVDLTSDAVHFNY
jgi:hypothetical protein